MATQADQSRARRPEGWSDPAFARVADVVHLASGLVFPPSRQRSAEAGMRRAMSALGISDPDRLGREVARPGAARDAVLAELTVGETYFFRDIAQLDVLRSEILPSLQSARAETAPVRIWSAGCASGEEPYSVAILLRELGWNRPVEILGTDVARPRLEAARRGRYTRWSLRGVDASRVARWFRPREKYFQLSDEIRALVRFSTLNLVADDYPSAATHTNTQDLVLCRNVLIYFDMESVATIAARLLASLAPDGWLVLGPSDPPLSGLIPCEVVVTTGGVAYRRANRLHPEGEQAHGETGDPRLHRWHSTVGAVPVVIQSFPAAARPLPQDVIAPERAESQPSHPPAPVTPAGPWSLAAAAYAAADYIASEALALELLSRDPVSAPVWVILVRSLANQGRLGEASDQCTNALDQHRDSPELHYLHAMLLCTAGAYRQGAQAARRALYLDPVLVMAHLQLGEALATLGERQSAASAFEEAVRALRGVPDDAEVPASDGVPAARLRQIAVARARAVREPRTS